MPFFSSSLVTLPQIPALFTGASYEVLFEDNSRLVTLFVFHRQSRDSSVEQLHVACYMRDSVIGLIVARILIEGGG